MALQIWYLNEVNQGENIIAISSAIFSAISIIIAVLSMTMTKLLINAQEHTLVEMHVTSDEIALKARSYSKKSKKIKKGIAGIFGLEPDLIEYLSPVMVPNGLQLRMNLYVEKEQSQGLKYKDLIEEANQSGRLAEIVEKAWKLTNTPNVSKVECKLIQSKNEVKRLMSDIVATNIQMTNSDGERDSQNTKISNV